MGQDGMRVFFLLAVALILAGCNGGAGEPMYPVEGRVLLDEQPLSQGDIVLDPIDGIGASVSAQIRNGVFQLEAPAGEKRVDVRAAEATGELDEYDQPLVRQLIPRRYNIDSELTVTVSADGQNSFTLELTSDAD